MLAFTNQITDVFKRLVDTVKACDNNKGPFFMTKDFDKNILTFDNYS